MKMKSILLSMLAVAALVSCNKDDNGIKPQSEGPLIVSLPGAPSTYAVENEYAASTITPFYNDAIVYLLDAGGNAKAYTWSDAELKNRYKQFEEVVTPAKVIVVVNKGTAVLPTSDTNAAAIATALESLAIADQNKASVTLATMDNKGNAAGTYESIHQVALYGESTTISDMADWDAHDAKKCDITLKSLVSRFEIGTVQAAAGSGLSNLVVENVYINYFYTTYEKNASIAYTETTWPTPYVPTWATNAGNTAVTSAVGTKAYAYQVFTGLVPHIIYEISGDVDASHSLADGTTNTSFTGKFVTVTGFKEGGVDITSIDANKIYKMGLTGGGIEITPGIITPNPETTKYDLQVNITVAPWTSANVTPVI